MRASATKRSTMKRWPHTGPAVPRVADRTGRQRTDQSAGGTDHNRLIQPRRLSQQRATRRECPVRRASDNAFQQGRGNFRREEAQGIGDRLAVAQIKTAPQGDHRQEALQTHQIS